MEIQINITSFEADVKPVIRDDEIKAFVTWFFESDNGKIKITGGTIKIKEFGQNKIKKLTFDGPAIKTKYGRFFKVLFIDNIPLYKQLCDYTIKKYIELSGELPPDIFWSEDYQTEEINLDDIPL
jgi:hypothetical protein